MAYVLTIAGVAKTIQSGWEINATQNGRSVFRFTVKSTDGSYRPALDAEVIFQEDGVTIFGGYIIQPSEAGIGDIGWAKIETTCQAQDYNILATRRHVTASLPAGTLKAALTAIVPFITGVTLDPAQVNGPSLEAQEWVDVNVEDALNQLTTLSGYVWQVTFTKLLRMYNPGTIAAPFNVTVPNCKAVGDVVVEPQRQYYANSIIVRTALYRKTAVNAAEVTARGAFELVVSAPDETTELNVQALANAILADTLPVLKRVQYVTREKALFPGMTQTITLPTRNVNNTFLVTDVSVYDENPKNIVMRRVTAIEGLVYRQGWRETYKRWNSGSGTSVAGGGSGGGGGGGPQIYAYFLGGSGLEFVQSPTPTWVAACALEVQINTALRDSTSAVITGRLRALDAGVSVQARLFDVTTAAACPGLSTVVTSTAWTTVQWTVTLTAGSHFYRVEVLPGTANRDVAFTGYIE